MPDEIKQRMVRMITDLLYFYHGEIASLLTAIGGATPSHSNHKAYATVAAFSGMLLHTMQGLVIANGMEQGGFTLEMEADYAVRVAAQISDAREAVDLAMLELGGTPTEAIN